MKIYLKKDWGQFIDYKNISEDDNYIGRNEQIEHLKNTIINNDSGSILVSGERGTGKTAFIYKTIKEIKKDENNKIIPILVNVNQIYENGEKVNNELLIKNLIKRLYSELRDETKYKDFNDSVKEKLKNLYKKAVFKYEREERNTNKKLNSQESRNETIENIETKIDKIEILKILVMFGVSVGSFNLLSNYIIESINLLEGIWFYISIILVFLIFFTVIYFLFTKISIEYIFKKVVVKGNDEMEEVLEIYKKDNSIGSLEFDLNELLDELNNDYIILFVIDELDKISGEGNEISNLIKMYKNLFTLSKANFIFITDQKFYLDLIDRDKTIDEQPTLFTFKYYLEYPSFDDLRNYLNHIINKKEGLNKNFKNIIINYILFDSNNDFFKLKETIHSLIKYQNGEGFLDIKELLNNDKYIKEKSKLYEKFELIYNKYKSSKISLFHNNYIELKELFNKLGNSFNGDISSINNSDNGEILKNVIIFLERTNIIKKDDSDIYIWTSNYGLLDEVDLDYKTEQEKEFIDSFLKYVELINRINDIGNNFDKYDTNKKYKTIHIGKVGEEFTGNIGALNLYNKYKEDYIKLSKGQIIDFISFDILEQSILDLTNNINNLENNYYQIFINIFKKVYVDLTHTGTNNGEIANVNLRNRFTRFKGNFFYLDNIKIIILNNFNEGDIIDNDEVKYLEDNNYIIVNICDETSKKVSTLEYIKEQEAKSKLGKLFTRNVKCYFDRIINIKSFYNVEGYNNKEFEDFYFGVKEIRKVLKNL